MTKKIDIIIMAYGTPYKESDIKPCIQILDMVNVHLKKNSRFER